MNAFRARHFPGYALALTAVLSCASALTWAAPEGSTPLPDAPPPPDYGPERPDPVPPRAALPESPEANAPEPEVTIVQRENATFEEYRVNGRLYKIKVTPKVGPPYYLVDEEGSNVWRRYDSFDTGFQVPRWVILRF